MTPAPTALTDAPATPAPAVLFSGWVAARSKVPGLPGECPLWVADVGPGFVTVCVDTIPEFFAFHDLDAGGRWPVPGFPGYVLTVLEVGRLGWEWAANITLERDQP